MHPTLVAAVCPLVQLMYLEFKVQQSHMDVTLMPF